MDKLNKEELKVLLECTLDQDDDIFRILLGDADLEDEMLMAIMNKCSYYPPKDRLGIEALISSYSENEFRKHFRIKRSLFEYISAKFNSSEIYQNLRPDKRSSARIHTAVFLWFAGHEACSFRDLAKRFNLSLSTVSRIIDRYVVFVSKLSTDIITWPNEQQKKKSSHFFKNKVGFSKAIGCIGLTRIAIDLQNNMCKKDYTDRKGNVSLCLQAVCNEQNKFISMITGFPGSSHENWVFKNSLIYQNLAAVCGDYYLLGDFRYPCSDNLVTPYKNRGNLTHVQKDFNLKLRSCRAAIEHTFQILKQRFPQLNHCKLRGIEKICHFIRACCVLHNMAIEEGLDFSSEPIEDSCPDNMQNADVSTISSVRDIICQELQENQSD